MRARLHAPATVVLHFPTPKNRLPFLIRGLQLQPHIKCVNRPARKKVPHLLRPHHHIHAHVVPAPHRRIYPSQRRRHRPHFSRRTDRPGHFRLFSHRKRSGKLWPSRGTSSSSRRRSRARRTFRRNRKNIHSHLLIPQKRLTKRQLRRIHIRRGHRRIRD